MAAQTIDYAALARQAEQDTAPPKVDYAALARQAEAESSAPQPTYTPPPGNTIGAAPEPSLLDRFRGTIANSAIGHSLESTLPKVADALNLHPTETVNSPTYQSDKGQVIAPQYLIPGTPKSATGNVTKGVLQGVGTLTSGRNMATAAGIAATAGLAAPLAGGVGTGATLARYAGSGAKVGMAAVGAKGLYDQGKQAATLYGNGDKAGAEQAAGAMIPNAALMLPALGKPMEALGEGMQTRGENVINSTVGALKKNYARGASPGEGYFQAGFGPSASMTSIANKAGDALDTTGSALGGAVDTAAQRGVLLPYEAGSKPIVDNIAQTRGVMGGFGGSSNTAPIDDYESTVQPLLSSAQQNGGFNPSDYFAAKKNLAKNVQWGDPTQIGMKSLRQNTVGGMAAALGDAIPEVKPLASRYQNLMQLQDIAQQRADTGSYPLSKIAKLAVAGSVFGGGGLARGNTAEAALGAVAPLVLDSVPVRTTAASGLFYGGKALSAAGGKLGGLFGASPAPIGANVFEEHNVNQIDNPTPNSIEQSAPPYSSLYGKTNLTPEIIRPGDMSRSKFGLGSNGQGGVMVRPLAGLPAPLPPASVATPYEWTPQPPSAIPAASPASLSRGVGSSAKVIPESVLGNRFSGGSEAERAAALRQVQLGSTGNAAPLRSFAPASGKRVIDLTPPRKRSGGGS